MVADFFRKLGDFESAVQFLVLSQANEEAFKMAQEHNQLSVYADVLDSNGGTPDDYRRVASASTACTSVCLRLWLLWLWLWLWLCLCVGSLYWCIPCLLLCACVHPLTSPLLLATRVCALPLPMHRGL